MTASSRYACTRRPFFAYPAAEGQCVERHSHRDAGLPAANRVAGGAHQCSRSALGLGAALNPRTPRQSSSSTPGASPRVLRLISLRSKTRWSSSVSRRSRPTKCALAPTQSVERLTVMHLPCDAARCSSSTGDRSCWNEEVRRSVRRQYGTQHVSFGLRPWHVHASVGVRGCDHASRRHKSSPGKRAKSDSPPMPPIPDKRSPGEWTQVGFASVLLMAACGWVTQLRRRWAHVSVAPVLLTAALASLQACSHDQLDAAAATGRDASVNERSDAAVAARPDAAAPYDRPETPGPCDQPDGPCHIPCNFDKSPLCPGTQRCVIGCEYGAVAQYCREPDTSALALGEKCTEPKSTCREGGCMQEPRGSDGARCTAFCVVDDDCPTDTHCVASNFSFGCEAGRQTFKEGLCRPLSVANPPP